MDSAHLSLRTLFCGIRYNFDKLEVPLSPLSLPQHSLPIVPAFLKFSRVRAVSGSPSTRLHFLISRSVSAGFAGSCSLLLILHANCPSLCVPAVAMYLGSEINIPFVYSVPTTKLTFGINCSTERAVFHLSYGTGLRLNKTQPPA